MLRRFLCGVSRIFVLGACVSVVFVVCGVLCVFLFVLLDLLCLIVAMSCCG